MPKTIKEVQQDYTGHTTVEYSDGSTKTYTAADLATFSSDSEAGPIVVSSSAPVNADGRPDGTIYIQTA